ncbi:RHS repeat domain-containing protein [Salinispirillum marinum]|uniref:RHS repeat domain-containing protein n=2 Tax=Saccharospirillaceae TaxID=255527 RepID=A0ABV8BEY4_9GAMM
MHSGQLKTLTAPGGQQTAYEYDGFLLTGTQWNGPVSGALGYEYNHYFEPTRQLLNGMAVDWQFNADSQLIQAGDLSLNYGPIHGLLTSTQLGSLYTGQNYNALGELSEYSASQYGSVLYHYALHRDDVGRINGITENLGVIPTEYQYLYDQHNRLAQVLKNGISVQSWQYDSNGNRTHENGSLVAQYDAQDRLLQYGDNQYRYTANGERTQKTNAISGETTDYHYDAFSNLRTVTLPDSTQIEYLIDGQNRRVGKIRNGIQEQGFLYQDQLNPVAELDGNNNVTARFIYADKGHVPSYMIKNGNNYRIVSDHLGSVRLVVNTSNGEIAQRMDYDAWGNVTNDTNPGFQPFGYAGGIYDRDTELVRFGARDYDPEVGRWTTKDPIGFGGGDLNVYQYSASNPINYRDENGLWVVQAVGGFVGFASGAYGAYLANGSVTDILVAGAVGGVVGVIAPSTAVRGVFRNMATSGAISGFESFGGQVIANTIQGRSALGCVGWAAVAGSSVGGFLGSSIVRPYSDAIDKMTESTFQSMSTLFFGVLSHHVYTINNMQRPK